jgi:uncharacterized protein YjbI with pentapeptide repeats
MLEPKRAPVRPRVISPVTGDTLPLEDEILDLIERRWQGVVWLTGGPGSGKTTALAHLAAVLPPSAKVDLRDVAERQWPNSLAKSEKCAELIVQCAPAGTAPKESPAVFQLAPWTADEIMEYLLAAHRDRCASVLDRCGSQDDKAFLRGVPELWRRTLDGLVADENLRTAKAGLMRVLELQLPTKEVRELAGDWSLALLLRDEAQGGKIRALIEKLCDFAGLLRLLTHVPVLLLLAAERIADELQTGGPCRFLKSKLYPELIAEVAKPIREDVSSQRRLQRFLTGNRYLAFHCTAASLMHAASVDWKPERQNIFKLGKWLLSRIIVVPELGGAILNKAQWPRVDLSRMKLSSAELNDADLSEANLSDADAGSASLCRARLVGAKLERIQAGHARLASADLSNIRAENAQFQDIDGCEAVFAGATLIGATFRFADLSGAQFTRANLNAAYFNGANIEGADFSGANLTGAWFNSLRLHVADFSGCCFHEAQLDSCDLEGMNLPGADFSEAHLPGALLTESSFPGANFRGADLTNTGLADIDWEGVDLREANLSGASFHLGSSRSGLVDSPIASLGSRTGFYTDDFNEQDFKSPEEIRKANLRGADLRGANIKGVDFYLVDLRDAIYHRSHEEHFRACGAILETRVV